MIPFDIMRCILEDVGTRQPTQAEAEAIARHLADGHGKLAGLSDVREAARKPARAPGPDHILRVDTVMRMSGLSYATLWRHERAGKFPKRHKIGKRAVGWRESEVQAWIAARP